MSRPVSSTDGWRARWARWSGPRSRDVAIIVLCGLNTLIQAYVISTEFGLAQALIALVLGAIATSAMWWRRRSPLVVTAIAAVLYVPAQVLLPLGFGLLTIAVQRRDRVLVAATVVMILCLVLPNQNSGWPPSIDLAGALGAVFGALFWALWGAYVGARRDLVASLRERAVRAEEERERKADQARLAERARIAREMHDVLAHKVSLIALQAGGLEVNPGIGADRVQQTAGLIRSTAREALDELRGVLGVLRADESRADGSLGTPPDRAELAPQPGLSEVAALVESSRAAGVRVVLTVDVDELPLATGRTVYRVVQEALTNVHKHARGAATEILISRRSGPNGAARGAGEAGSADGDVMVMVTNRRPVAAGSMLPGSGSGLIGLRERVALLGGTLIAGPTGDGGWRVQALLPVAGSTTAAPSRDTLLAAPKIPARPASTSTPEQGAAAWRAS